MLSADLVLQKALGAVPSCRWKEVLAQSAAWQPRQLCGQLAVARHEEAPNLLIHATSNEQQPDTQQQEITP